MSRLTPAVRRVLVFLWLISAGLIVLGCINILVALKTGSPLVEIAGGKGFPVPPWIYESPFAFYFLGCSIAPGYLSKPFEPGCAPVFLLLIVLIALAGAWLLYRSALRSGIMHQRTGASLSHVSTVLGAGLLTAGAVCFLLEAFGLWQKLAPHPDPRQEQGAPFWVWWGCAALATACWYFVLRKSGPHSGTWHDWAKRLSWLAVNGLLLAAVSLAFHILRPEPTQGRYYGIDGFIVGRAGNTEYGTYYGMVSGIVVFLIVWIRLAMMLRFARPSPQIKQWL